MTKGAKQLETAFWESGGYALVFLGADHDRSAGDLPLKLGPDETSFASVEPLAPEEVVRFTRYYRNGDEWVFRLEAKRYPQLQDPTLEV
ncbi:MAG: hypothetical protein GWO81_01970 [Verrucomicrobia bacterium]|nr:hypothetical protein [Verrucomicrobiota bacterium]